VQYLSHAELLNGLDSEPIEARLREIAADELKHQGMLRNVIGKLLGEAPSMGFAPAHKATETREMLKVNLDGEAEALEHYIKTWTMIKQEKANLPFCYAKLKHEIKHIAMDEEEHMAELKQLLGMK
jgi:bacterioferritin (cytochrome b1)